MAETESPRGEPNRGDDDQHRAGEVGADLTGAPRPMPHRSRFNDSPTRQQLVDIAAEAYARESDR